MAKENKLYVERETYEKNDKHYYSYFLRGTIRGRDVKISIVPPNRETDMGGYNVFDIVFGDSMSAELVITPFEIKDEKNGKVVKGNSYGIKSVDEDGKVYECSIKPFRASDKALLKMLLG